MPQIAGGAFPPFPVTVNVSVKHCVAELTVTPLATVVILSPLRIAIVLTAVLGPVITKVLKSRRS